MKPDKLDISCRRILFVDDCANSREALRRTFRKEFVVETASNAAEAITAMETKGPFAVVVTDLVMPGMNGVALLSRISERWPDTVRVMLTGHADLNVSISAVNAGNVFRFVTKPAEISTMRTVLSAACEQYRLVTSERSLLEETLSGTVRVLTEMLAISNPVAFGRTVRIRSYTIQLVRLMGLDDTWQIEVAAMLSQIGCLAIPSQVLEKILSGQPVDQSESAMFREHPEVARKLINDIPRLDKIARMIANQHKDAPDIADTDDELVRIGSCILRISNDLDSLVARGTPTELAIEKLSSNRTAYDPGLRGIIHEVEIAHIQEGTRNIRIDELESGMILSDDVRSKDGVLIMVKGQTITDVVIRGLSNRLQQGTIPPAVRITCRT